VGAAPVSHPLVDVAVHVVETPGIGLLRADSMGFILRVPVIPGVLIETFLIVSERPGGPAAGTGRVLPLRLSRQVATEALAGRLRVVPTDAARRQGGLICLIRAEAAILLVGDLGLADPALAQGNLVGGVLIGKSLRIVGRRAHGESPRADVDVGDSAFGALFSGNAGPCLGRNRRGGLVAVGSLPDRSPEGLRGALQPQGKGNAQRDHHHQRRGRHEQSTRARRPLLPGGLLLRPRTRWVRRYSRLRYARRTI